MAITCDRCGREMNDQWKIDGMEGTGGNCSVCGNNLCAECAGTWKEGECKLCSMTIEELEFALPLRIQKREKKEMPCSDCKRTCDETVDYEQRIWRSDDFGFDGKHKKRTYEISYVRQYSHGKYLFRTERYHSLRQAFIEAYNTLKKMGFGERYGL